MKKDPPGSITLEKKKNRCDQLIG